MAPLILYHFPPSNPSRVALLAIRNLGLDVEVHEVDLWKKEQLKEDFVKINPQHTVPTINDNGFILWESRAIATYLADRDHPDVHRLYPKEVHKRALINQRLQFDCGTLHPRIRAICYPVIFLGETKIDNVNRERLYEALGFLESFLDGKKFVAGDELSLADISILVSVTSIDQIGGDLSRFKNISEWYERNKSLPGWQENYEGAKLFAERVLSNLKEKL